jgi:hypothetical protein
MLGILRRCLGWLADLARPDGLFAGRREAKAYQDMHEVHAVRHARTAIRPY